MSSTRYTQQPLQIYQDPGSAFDSAPMPSFNSNLKKISPLRPLKNAASRNSVVFNPPQTGRSKQSPYKSLQPTSSSPLRAPSNNKLHMIPMPPPGGASNNTDSMQKKPMMSNFKPQKVLFTTFPSDNSREKENYPVQPSRYTPLAPYTISQENFSLDGLFPARPTPSSLPQKRLLDAAPIHEARPIKRAKVEELHFAEECVESSELPDPSMFPPLHDDGSKPPHSYATLIGMSILRAPNRRLTLAQIYKWISDTYSFYSATDAGWQNSIRHNLSLNKAFIKQERPKDDPGKGNYWAIQPGMEHQFLKDKVVRRPAGPNENVPVLNANLTPIDQVQEPPRFKTLVPAPPDFHAQSRQALPDTRFSEPQLPAIQEEISSDATIPNSDAVGADPEAEDKLQDPEPSSPLIQSSPPTAMMHSSPPIPRQAPKQHDTPPPVPLFDSSSRAHRSHKRKYASMDDSGYFSSLESSAMRPQRALLSDTEHSRLKRGRAEDEIARLRGSSYDSPTKTRHTSFLGMQSSSPVRRMQMGPPLTPAIKLKPPTRAPPSVSPNTHLRLHRDRVREMVGSPLRGMTVLEDDNHPWSPAVQLDANNDLSYVFQDYGHGIGFDIFNDMGASPEKRSAKRPRLDRSKSANMLADITSSSSASLNRSIDTTSTPSLKPAPSLNANTALNSPLKSFNSPLKSFSPFTPGPHHFPDSPTKYAKYDDASLNMFSIPGFEDHEDFFGTEEWLSEDLLAGGNGASGGAGGMNHVAGGVEDGFDLCAGTFQKIGSAVVMGKENAGGGGARGTPKMGAAGANANGRPGFGRSMTSRF